MWKPIETAPRGNDDEDVWILAITAGARIPFVTAWDHTDDEWYTFNRHYEATIQPHNGEPWKPTHWMPIPTPPETSST